VNWEKLKRQLAREAREYLADVRALKSELKSIEGWIALALLIAALCITAAWAFVSLGFNPPNEHVANFMLKLGVRQCRVIDNFSGVVLFVNMFLVIFLTAITFGNVLNVIKRVKRGQPRQPRDLIISSALMLGAGIGGIAYMAYIC